MGEKDKVLEVFDKAVLVKQVKTAEDIIKQAQEQVVKLQAQIQQQLGVLALSKHLLSNYELPETQDASK